MQHVVNILVHCSDIITDNRKLEKMEALDCNCTY